MPSKIVERCSLSDAKSLLAHLRKITSTERGYFVGFSSLDGTECPLEQALNEGIASGMGFAILLDDATLFIREEQLHGRPTAFLLRK